MKKILFALLFPAVCSAQSLPICTHGNLTNGTLTADVTDTNPGTIIAAPGAGYRLYVSGLCITNNDATVGTVVVVSCSATSSKRVRLNAAAVGGGFCQPLGYEMRCDSNTALTVTPETTSAQIQAAAWGCISTQ